jgi:hypothetical protein
MNEQIPQYLKLRSSKKKHVQIFVICLVFVACGVWMTQDKDIFYCIVGWISVVFFGAGVPIAGIHLFVPSRSYMELSNKGFTICTFFRKYFYRWDEISNIGVGVISFNKMVLFNFSEKFKRAKGTRKVLRFISGAEAGFHDTFGLKAEELAKLMTEFKNRYDSELQSGI